MISFSGNHVYHEPTGETTAKNLDIEYGAYLQRKFIRDVSLPATGAIVLRRKALCSVGMFDESLRRSQDTDLWLRVMMRYGFGHIPRTLVWVRRGPHQTIRDAEDVFPWQHKFYAKHRYTFGKGLKGRIIWGAGYGNVLRRHATWYLRKGERRKAARTLLKALWLWPFVRTRFTCKLALELALGETLYRVLTAPLRRIRAVLVRAREVVWPKPSQQTKQASNTHRN